MSFLHNSRRPHLHLVALLTLLTPTLAQATNGYFSNGYGAISQGIAGIGIALPLDGLAAASNPAGTALVGDRTDLGIDLFRPKREATISGNGFGANGNYDGNGKKNFFIPDLALTKQISSTTGLGLAVYGNGGMNTDYKTNPYGAFGSTGHAGVNLSQLFITPSLAYRVTPKHSVGLALNVAYQRFKAYGLSAFDNPVFSSSPGNVTDRGADSSTGVGVRLGYIGEILPDVTLGLTWASRIRTGKLDRYKGLFANEGGFDVPENYGIGLSYRPTSSLTLALEGQHINYSDINSIATPLAGLLSGNKLGSANGPGFGWKDVTVWRVGASYDVNSTLTLRAGYSHSDQPIPQGQTFFNILAPATVRDHLTFGATWKASASNEISAFYAHGFRETVKGSGSIPAAFGGGEANISLEENILGLSWGHKF
ncbi:OmpP1/FadL family transporter [Uliginosibacterium gangwonense]|uniref:OmpP1/FadL family transporter n=1 Tax=Uliginosibacterium gangwonense TaxID=392736 RepID=UPI0003824420|nr:outer membrane protein transport protein [Uliginosibacterium gangwonense]